MSEQDTSSKKKFNLKGLWWKIPLILIALVWFISTLGVGGGLPACDSSNAKNTLAKSFDNSQFARNLNLKAIEVSGVQEVAGSSEKQRNCSGNITMNNSKVAPVVFKMNLRDDGQYLLKFEVQQ
jgi:hypothetical protein